MKDLEKIKSEDLAAQVQDANPANFAIEQEVAQLVGATVPQPTEPSADDARELEAQLLVFLRRALTPIQTALRTALADIYAHLDSRCTDYTPADYAPFRILPYDPMTTPRAPRSVANLPTALTAFAPRKISNGSATADGIPDGISLAHLLLNNSVTEILDDNSGYAMIYAFPWSCFPSVKKATFRFNYTTLSLITNNSVLEELYVLGLREATNTTFISSCSALKRVVICGQKFASYNSATITNCANLDYVEFADMEDTEMATGATFGGGGTWNCTIKDIVYPKLKRVRSIYGNASLNYSDINNSMRFPSVVTIDHANLINPGWYSGGRSKTPSPTLMLIEIGQGFSSNISLDNWSPTNVLADETKTATFLQNFKEHIALRLTANGSGKTLTLSQAVFSAVIEGSSPICDDIKGIIEDKGWKVQDTNNNIFPTT